MRQIIIFILLFLFSFTSRAQNKSVKDSIYTILITGAPTRRSQIAAELSPKIGFQYKYISYNHEGDIIFPPNIDSMHKENEKTYKLMAKAFGANWQKIFNKEVDRTYENWGRIKDFLDSSTIFENLLAKLNLENYGDFRILKEIQANKVFVVEYTFYDRVKHITLSKRNFKLNLAKSEMKVVTSY